jgi:hypothetical protein
MPAALRLHLTDDERAEVARRFETTQRAGRRGAAPARLGLAAPRHPGADHRRPAGRAAGGLASRRADRVPRLGERGAFRHRMRPDLPPLDEQIDTMLAHSGMKASYPSPSRRTLRVRKNSIPSALVASLLRAGYQLSC